MKYEILNENGNVLNTIIADESFVSANFKYYKEIVEVVQEEEYKDKLMQDKIKSVEQAVQSHINAKCVSLGYDNENSIAKYLVEGNPFYEECKSLSLWIGNVWVKTFSIINEVRPIPTIEEILAELPEFI